MLVCPGKRARNAPPPPQLTPTGRSRSSTPPPGTVGTTWLENRVALLTIGGAFIALFWPAFVVWTRDTLENPDLSHALLVPVISAFLVYRTRAEIPSLPAKKSYYGLSLLCFSLLVFFVGYRTDTNLLQRGGIWGSLLGSVWFLFGPKLFQKQLFPLVYLGFAIPLPHFVLSPLKLALKRLVTLISSDTLLSMGIPAMPQGNVLALDGHRLEVADACSGIRSLMAIVATAALFAYFFRTGVFRGSILVALSIPVAVAVNVLRVTTIAVALSGAGLDLTEGTAHDVVSMGVFAFSLVLLYAAWRLIECISVPTNRGAKP